jgi:transcriptional regulator with XRE-family HTH domain
MAKLSGVVTTERGTTAIAKRIAKIRQDCGITQVEMSKKLNTTQSIVSRYERGELRIHAELLLKLAKIFGVTPNELLGIDKKAAGNTGKIPRRFLSRLKDVHLLSKRDQDNLAQTMEALIQTAKRKKAGA